MQVKNGELKICMDFLDELKLPNKASLGRTKLKGGFAGKLEEYSKDQVAIVDEYDAWKDKEKGTYDNTNKEMVEALDILALDDVEIEFNSPFKKDFIKGLEDYDEELSGTGAEVYAKLYEELTKENE